MLFIVPKGLIQLLEQVIEKHCPDCLRLIVEGNRLELTPDERQCLEDAILSEFLTELGPDGEPTLRGRQLDDLISVLTRHAREGGS